LNAATALEVVTAKTDSGRRQLVHLRVISIHAAKQEEFGSNHDGFATNSLALGTTAMSSLECLRNAEGWRWAAVSKLPKTP
jgi:hypothetical protein